MPQKTLVEKIIGGVGSAASLVVHTLLFSLSFVLALIGVVSWSTMLLVLTTIVSLEAIYLAIFIQMSVNRQAVELAEVSEDVEDIQEDVGEIQKDVDEIQKDVDEIQEDVDEIQEDVGEIQEDVEEITDEDGVDEQREKQQAATLEQLTQDVRRLLADLEQLKKG
ncbi:MAG: hypothetical protein WCT45_00870 [Candidatus Paceibacterota bacterium]|jgi:uncharacterized membrane protein